MYRKFDGSLHWNFPGRVLADDHHGVWVGCPAGTPARRGTELGFTQDHPSVSLFPRDAWWTATFNADPHKLAVYCDISTIPTWQDDTVTMIDLDLDVVLRRGEPEPFVDDEDEFAEHQVRYAYPPDVIEQAQAAADWLMAAVRDRRGPFDGAHERYLAEVR